MFVSKMALRFIGLNSVLLLLLAVQVAAQSRQIEGYYPARLYLESGFGIGVGSIDFSFKTNPAPLNTNYGLNLGMAPIKFRWVGGRYFSFSIEADYQYAAYSQGAINRRLAKQGLEGLMTHRGGLQTYYVANGINIRLFSREKFSFEWGNIIGLGIKEVYPLEHIIRIPANDRNVGIPQPGAFDIFKYKVSPPPGSRDIQAFYAMTYRFVRQINSRSYVFLALRLTFVNFEDLPRDFEYVLNTTDIELGDDIWHAEMHSFVLPQFRAGLAFSLID